VYVPINPVIEQVTRLAVKEDLSPNREYIVPVDFVTQTIADTIRVRCGKAELEKMDPFIKKTFIEKKLPNEFFVRGGGMRMGESYYLPDVTSHRTVQVSVDTRQVPPGQLTVRRGTRVEADGRLCWPS
jgi:hypothetical protein